MSDVTASEDEEEPRGQRLSVKSSSRVPTTCGGGRLVAGGQHLMSLALLFMRE